MVIFKNEDIRVPRESTALGLPRSAEPRWASPRLDVDLIRYAVIASGARQRQFSTREARLLARLVPARSAPVCELIELIWPDPDSEPEGSRHTLGQIISNMNKRLAPLGFRIVADWARRYWLKEVASQQPRPLSVIESATNPEQSNPRWPTSDNCGTTVELRRAGWSRVRNLRASLVS
jgi:hypothetical protein